MDNEIVCRKETLEIEFDEIPMEFVTFDANSNRLSIEADSSSEQRVKLEFTNVKAFSYANVEDYAMEMFCVEDFFCPSLYEKADDSDGRESRCFFLPTQEGVWEIHTTTAPELVALESP